MNDPGRSVTNSPEGPNAGAPGPGPRSLWLSEHTHAGHIYESRDEQLDVTAAFFRASLVAHLRCVYVHDQGDDAAAVQGLARAGLDVSSAIQSSAFELADRRQLPAQPGELQVEGLMAFMQNRAEAAMAEGFDGVRGVGDMAWTMRADPAQERLMEYESRVTGAVNSLSAAVLCQYDRSRFAEMALFEVICTHPWLVVAGTLCQNPYYVPQASFAQRERGTLDLDQALGNVLARERQERWLAVAEGDLEAHGEDIQAVDVGRLAAIYEHMRDYKRALRERVRWREERQPRTSAARREMAALDGEIEWLQQRASLWRRRELQSSGLFFEPVSGTLAYRGRAVGLSRLEVALLRVLLEQAGRPIHSTQLIRVAWERDVRTEAQLRNYIARLRSKLETLGVPAQIVTHRGRGYRLATGSDQPPTD